jgi:hypothetical protein
VYSRCQPHPLPSPLSSMYILNPPSSAEDSVDTDVAASAFGSRLDAPTNMERASVTTNAILFILSSFRNE